MTRIKKVLYLRRVFLVEEDMEGCLFEFGSFACCEHVRRSTWEQQSSLIRPVHILRGELGCVNMPG